jgi:hypothetical protein
MNIEDKNLKLIEFLENKFKNLTDFCVKLVYAHLAVTAFSITIYFQNQNQTKLILQIGNILINVMVVLSIIHINKDIRGYTNDINILLDEIQSKINHYTFLSMVGKYYMIFSIILLSFWFFISFL